MARFAFIAVFVSVLASVVSAAPVARGALVTRAFKELPHAQFQISDGTAGQADAKANRVCVDPFQGQDLAKVDAATLDALENMREAAEDAETEFFNTASQMTLRVLKAGKIQNKVLKLTCLAQVLNIQLAQAPGSGKDTASIQTKLAEERTKLANNIVTDKKNAGAASKGVA